MVLARVTFVMCVWVGGGLETEKGRKETWGFKFTETIQAY